MTSNRQIPDYIGSIATEIFDSYSALRLIAANCVVMVWALWQRWPAITVIWVYWTQSILIGLFWSVRILCLKRFSVKDVRAPLVSLLPPAATRISVAAFFFFHYGIVHAFYAHFLYVSHKQAPPVKMLSIAAVLFCVNHILSLRRDLEQDAGHVPNIGKLMSYPYARIIPMHGTMFIGGILNSSGGQVTLLIFMLLKTLADAFMHVKLQKGFRDDPYNIQLKEEAGTSHLKLPDGRLIPIPDNPELAKKIDAMLKLPPEVQQKIYKEVLGRDLLSTRPEQMNDPERMRIRKEILK